jgi:hypothetical protein
VTAALAAAVVVALSPNPAHFGQIVTATVRGEGTPNLAPFAVLGRHGNVYSLQCLDPACVPGAGPRAVTVGGRRLVIVPRTTSKDVADPLRSFRRETTLPPPTYRIRPRLLQALLLAGALLLLAAAAVAALPAIRRLFPRRVDRRSPLERALALVRASTGRSSEDRRRALDLLARSLERPDTAGEALQLAWSQAEPGQAPIESLVQRIEAAG